MEVLHKYYPYEECASNERRCSPYYLSFLYVIHVFFDCDFAIHCWQLIGLELDIWNVEHAASWLLNRLATDTHENVIKIATVLWGKWVTRNKLV